MSQGVKIFLSEAEIGLLRKAVEHELAHLNHGSRLAEACGREVELQPARTAERYLLTMLLEKLPEGERLPTSSSELGSQQ